MKRTLVGTLLLLLSIGCNKDHKLTFEPLRLENRKCASCPKIDIDIPKALDDTPLGMRINAALREELIYNLKFEDSQNVATIEQAMASFTKSYQELQSKFPDETPGWEAAIKGALTYEDEHIITIRLDAYNFTGGAHGNGSSIFLNFDKEKAVELDNYQLFEDLEGFQNLAEVKFREQEHIPAGANINATGFMFSRDSFHLSENMGFTEKGFQLIYNQYEVASYADGPIITTIPFEEANRYLKHKVQP